MKDIIQKDNQYFFNVFGKRIAQLTHGGNCNLYDENGKKYTDFLAGIAVNCLGYSDEGFKTAVKNQVDSLIHVSNYFYNEPQTLLAEELCTKTGFSKVFFSNSGAEANECAIKIAKKYAFEKGIINGEFITLKNSFHGRTVATLFATGQNKFHVPYNPSPYPFNYIDANDLAQLNTITKDTYGVIIEVIQGEGGVIPLNMEYVKNLREICTKYDVPLIIDEVQTGMGRTGKFLAQEHYGIKGDIATLAKGLGNGIPIGACLAYSKFADVFKQGDHGSTFGGNLLACRAGLYVTQHIEPLFSHITTVGEYFREKLKCISKKIIDVRGLGLMIGAQLCEDVSAHDVFKTLFEKGFIIGTSGFNTLRFVPPYIITKKEIDEVIHVLGEVLN